MNTLTLKSCLMFVLVNTLISPASDSNAFILNAFESDPEELADLARREAERRKRLEEEGIEGKVIDANTVAKSSSGNLFGMLFCLDEKRTDFRN